MIEAKPGIGLGSILFALPAGAGFLLVVAGITNLFGTMLLALAVGLFLFIDTTRKPSLLVIPGTFCGALLAQLYEQSTLLSSFPNIILFGITAVLAIAATLILKE